MVHRLVVPSLVATLLAAALLVPPPTPARADLAGPLAEWTFDEGAGSTAADATGNGHEGTLGPGASWTSAGSPQGSGSLVLHGPSGAVHVPDAPDLEAASVSVIAWVRDPGPSPAIIAAKGDRGCRAPSWMLALDGGLRFSGSAPGDRSWSVSAPGSFADGGWHQVAASFDGMSATAHVYVDGRQYGGYVSEGASGIQYGGADLSSGDLFLGAAPDCPWWNGLSGGLDDVRVYGRPIDQSELWQGLPRFGTTTTATVEQTLPTAGSTIRYRATVSPTPPAGSVVFWLSRDGGPETAGPSAQIDDLGDAYWENWGGQEMPPGEYTLRATFAGAGPAAASSSPAVPFTIVPIPTVVTASAPQLIHLPGAPITLRAVPDWGDDVGRSGQPGGSVSFYDITGGGRVLLGSAPVTLPCCVLGAPQAATLDVPGRPAGSYEFEVRYDGSENIGTSTSTVAVTVAKGASGASVTATPDPVQAHHPVTIGASAVVLGEAGWETPTSGTLEIRDTDTEQVLASGPAGQPLEVTTATYPVGDHHLVAVFSGTDQSVAATSDPTTLTVRPDVVEATGVGVSYGTFYPVRDGYRDTLAIVGTRQESVAVAIRIYGPTGRLVASSSIAAGTGAYRFTWTGRSRSGAMLGTGRYRITQTLTDLAGTRRVVSSLSTLSAKRLVWYAKTLLRAAGSYSASGHWGVGRVIRSSAAKVVIRGGGYDGAGYTGWAGVGYQFTLPSAAVYRSLTFGLDSYSGAPPASMGVWDFSTCAYSSSTTWPEGCFHRWRSIGPSLAWYSVTMSPTGDRHGTIVRGSASVYLGEATIVGARIRVTYGLLK